MIIGLLVDRMRVFQGIEKSMQTRLHLSVEVQRPLEVFKTVWRYVQQFDDTRSKFRPPSLTSITLRAAKISGPLLDQFLS